MSYQKLAVDLKAGNTILCANGTITLSVLSCDQAAGTVRCRCENTTTLGERKNINLLGVVVDLPTFTEKDKEDILGWGVPNNIDMIALLFVHKGSDLVNVRKVLGPHAKGIQLMSKVRKVLSTVWFICLIVFYGHLSRSLFLRKVLGPHAKGLKVYFILISCVCAGMHVLACWQWGMKCFGMVVVSIRLRIKRELSTLMKSFVRHILLWFLEVILERKSQLRRFSWPRK